MYGAMDNCQWYYETTTATNGGGAMMNNVKNYVSSRDLIFGDFVSLASLDLLVLVVCVVTCRRRSQQ